MIKALQRLDVLLTTPVQLLIGGGSAMMLAYDFPLKTDDIDGFPFRCDTTFDQLTPLIHQIAKELGIPHDWLNGHFNTFLFALPQDYGDRLKTIFQGEHLTVYSLGLEDLLLLKCFAGRPKDIGHARALLRKIPDYRVAEELLHQAKDKNLPGAEDALIFFEDMLDQLDI